MGMGERVCSGGTGHAAAADGSTSTGCVTAARRPVAARRSASARAHARAAASAPARTHARRGGWLGWLAAAAVAILIVSGGASHRARSAPASAQEEGRGARFRRITGIRDAGLERLYAGADTDRDGALSWEEISAFQGRLQRSFAWRRNDTVLRPDEFLALRGGDCEDWAELACGLLRYWGYEPYVGCFEPSGGGSGHAICLVRVDEPPPGFRIFTVDQGDRFVPIDYDRVGDITNAMSADWPLKGIYVPEALYGNRM
jgi:hypothetical protein